MYRCKEHTVEAVQISVHMEFPAWLDNMIVKGRAIFTTDGKKMFIAITQDYNKVVTGGDGDYIVRNNNRIYPMEKTFFEEMYIGETDEKPNND